MYRFSYNCHFVVICPLAASVKLPSMSVYVTRLFSGKSEFIVKKDPRPKRRKLNRGSTILELVLNAHSAMPCRHRMTSKRECRTKDKLFGASCDHCSPSHQPHLFSTPTLKMKSLSTGSKSSGTAPPDSRSPSPPLRLTEI